MSTSKKNPQTTTDALEGDGKAVSASRANRSRQVRRPTNGTGPSSLEIAQDAHLQPIDSVAESIGLLPEEIEPYGRYKAKISLAALDRLAPAAQGKLVCVAGENCIDLGSMTASISVGTVSLGAKFAEPE